MLWVSIYHPLRSTCQLLINIKVETRGCTLEEVSVLFGLDEGATKRDNEDSERNGEICKKWSSENNVAHKCSRTSSAQFRFRPLG